MNELIFFCLGVSIGIVAEYLVLGQTRKETKDMLIVAENRFDRAETNYKDSIELITKTKLINEKALSALSELNTIFSKMKSRAKEKH